MREEQGFLWSAFAFAFGIGLYFLLPEEPVLWVLLCCFIPVFVLAVRQYRRSGVSLFFMLGVWLFFGVVCGAIRTAVVDAPRLDVMRNLGIEGRVVERQETGKKTRLLIEVEKGGYRGKFVEPGPMPGSGVLPRRVRVSIPRESKARSGDLVRLRARLFPPGGPVFPGGYDFAFTAYFSGIGATGFSYGAPEILPDGDLTVRMRWRKAISNMRDYLTGRIRLVLGEGDSTELAVALLIGQRSGLSEQAEESLRAAGLAHVLAISGLHMALFAGGVYTALLALLASSENLALRFPLHRIAALCALAAALFYLVLSGAGVATQRSFIMISLVFAGTVFSRRGLTLHSVALAGILLLASAPENLMHAGFQMSFAAVICLVATYRYWQNRSMRNPVFAEASSRSFPALVLRKITVWFAGLLATTLIAGVATGVIAAHHFGRVAPYGLVGNALGMPLVSIFVMPLGILSLVLMPFGLASYPLHGMAANLDLLLDIARWTEQLDEGMGRIVPPGALATLCLTGALFTALLAHGRHRLWSCLPFGAAVTFIWFASPPDVQIGEQGKRIAVRDQEGVLRLSSTRSSFAADMWLHREGVSERKIKEHKISAPQGRCDEQGCVYLAYPHLARPSDGNRNQSPVQPLRIAMPKTAQALTMDCQFADVIVTGFRVPQNCEAGFIVAQDKRQTLGALSFWLQAVAVAPADRKKNDAARGAGVMNASQKSTIRYWQGARTVPPRPWHQ